MKVLQIIDSLDAGGAERMAVNIANELQAAGHESHLCVTRKEGLLKTAISNEVGYIFIEKKGKLGWVALSKLKRYIKEHQIELLHAHSTSAFTAVMILLLLRNKPKLIWHDHYGKANQLEARPLKVLRFLSGYFNQVISVNKLLKAWALKELKCESVTYLENFATATFNQELQTPLAGRENKRIVCLANLREQKDHLNLLKAFEVLKKECPEWSLHLCGQDFNDDYSLRIKQAIEQRDLKDHVFLLGSRADVGAVLNTCDIAVLSSRSEGLPVALLEYGLHHLPVVVTDVGACKEVVADYGIVVESENAQLLSAAILKLIDNKIQREDYATKFHNHVMDQYGSKRYINKLVSIYQSA
ncbi:glycosyltransferase [Nonlabens sp. Asnod2-A12]|uniref:glycosyltransferase n=1 Tax=Nonlabens sp. Asnod2-A12 TaxID=3160578 RepID=UPI00386D31A3